MPHIHQYFDQDIPVSCALFVLVVRSCWDEAMWPAFFGGLNHQSTFSKVISSDFCHWGAQFGYTRVGAASQWLMSLVLSIWAYLSCSSCRLRRACSQGSPGLAKTYRDGPHPDNAKIEVRSVHTGLLCFSCDVSNSEVSRAHVGCNTNSQAQGLTMLW